MKLVKGARIVHKRTNNSGETPTKPLVEDHTLGWLDTDIYESELFMNLADNRLYTRGALTGTTNPHGIVEFPVKDIETGKIKVSDLPTDILGAVRYQGTWDASTDIPPMTGMTSENRGYYWVVNISGNTDLHGDTGTDHWDVGDWAIYDGSKWGIVDNNGVIDSSETVYLNPAYPSLSTVKEALDQLLYVEPNINTFSISPSQVEIGTIIYTGDVTINWSVNKVMTNIVATGLSGYTSGNLAPGLSGTLTPALTASTDTTYTINIMDSASHTDSSSTTLYFRNKAYWGVSSNTGLTDNQIIALSNSILTNTRIRNLDFTGSNQYWYYVIPVSFGTPIFKYGANIISITPITRLFINESEYESSYNIYRSNQILLGSITINVT